MPRFLLHHSHEAHECESAFAAWAGFVSPLRHERAPSSCLAGGHEIWWQVEARSELDAFALLPPFVASRSRAIAIREVEIP